jgi:hypothetical protein
MTEADSSQMFDQLKVSETAQLRAASLLSDNQVAAQLT